MKNICNVISLFNVIKLNTIAISYSNLNNFKNNLHLLKSLKEPVLSHILLTTKREHILSSSLVSTRRNWNPERLINDVKYGSELRWLISEAFDSLLATVLISQIILPDIQTQYHLKINSWWSRITLCLEKKYSKC